MRIILASLILSVLYSRAALAQVYVTNSGEDELTKCIHTKDSFKTFCFQNHSYNIINKNL